MGCSAEGVIGGNQEIERAPGVALLVGNLPGVHIHPFHVASYDWRRLILDEPEELAERVGYGSETRAVIGFGDPFTTPTNQFLDAMDQRCPNAPLLGGMASSARGPGENVLLRNDEVLDDGFVGVSLSGPVRVDAVVSQGCRPIGQRLVVTKARGNVVEAVGGKSPLGVLREIIHEMPERDKQLLEHGLFLGKAISEYRETFGRGDFLVRNLMGADEKTGAVAVNGDVRVGQTVQFHVRDAATADEDLRLMLAKEQPDGVATPPAGALLFSCNGRGTRLFPDPCHDVGVAGELLPQTPVAGFFAAGELGPVGGKNFIHGHTASFAFFREVKD
jgi:small ligand-binding sensory domain FIST